jgi:RNA-directed DNA polymerase
MRDVGLELHPDKTRIIYCRDSARRQPWGGPVSFDFLGYAFRPRDTMGKNGRFTGFELAVSPKAIKRMSEIVKDWRLHRLTGSPGNSSLAGSARSSAVGWRTTAGSAIPSCTRCSPGSTTTSRNGSGPNTGGSGPTRP